MCFIGWVDRNLPPSPPSVPILGHLHLLGPKAHQSLAKLSEKYGPIMFLKLGTKSTLVISSPEMAKEVFKKHDLAFSQRPRMTCTDLLVTNKEGFAFQSNTPSWRNLRKIFMLEMLSPNRVQQAQKIRAQETAYMLKAILRDVTENPNTPIALNPKLSLLTTNFISQMILSKRYFSHDRGEETAEAKEFKYVNAEMMQLLGSIFPADCLPWLYWFDIGGLQKRTKTLYPRFQAILTTILSDRRRERLADGDAHVDKDLVDVLLSHEEKSGDGATLNELNIRGVVWDAFAGGTDTQVAATEWAMAHLIQSPDLIHVLRSEIDAVVGTDRRLVADSDIASLPLLQAVVKETFRLHPPTPLLLPHETHEPCKVAGFDVPAMTRLFVNVWAMGRDERVWEDPMVFNPKRFLEGELKSVDVTGQHFQLMPFGTGRRICPAVAIGMAGVHLFVASLVHAFDWSLPDGVVELDMSENVGMVTPMASPLRAVPSPRLPPHLYSVVS
ncbi:hypothetical protein M758_1G037100 [Ceratodon purpureus]|nr:hypothetical protein M758_1G037100 [Ceratodon purpureus]